MLKQIKHFLSLPSFFFFFLFFFFFFLISFFFPFSFHSLTSKKSQEKYFKRPLIRIKPYMVRNNILSTFMFLVQILSNPINFINHNIKIIEIPYFISSVFLCSLTSVVMKVS